jgi:hypothetical protein
MTKIKKEEYEKLISYSSFKNEGEYINDIINYITFFQLSYGSGEILDNQTLHPVPYASS